MNQVLRRYPNLAAILNSRVPSNLIPMIWNDPVIRQLASIITNTPVFPRLKIRIEQKNFLCFFSFRESTTEFQ